MCTDHPKQCSQICSHPLDISTRWQVLGPFQIGTREATWGADPLEYHGGFHSLVFDHSSIYDSSLAANGTVGWSIQEVDSLLRTETAVEAKISIGFPAVDWVSLQSIYGWAALQYQAWIRGEITIRANEPQTIILYTDNVLEFSIDGNCYFGGDFYAYRRAPIVLHLNAGPHMLDVRVVRDIRAMGGIDAPLVSLTLRAELSSGGLTVMEEKILLPEMIEGKLVSNVGSVPVRNGGEVWIDILGIESADEDILQVKLRDPPWGLAPGQSRGLSFDLALCDASSKIVVMRVIYQNRGSPPVLHTPNFSSAIAARTFDEPHRMTFLHPSGVVSYAILRCPKMISPNSSASEKLPVLLNLHGAGLEADSHQVRHMLDPVADIRAWTLSPTGGSLWSGDDWHTWGLADVESAIAAIPLWMDAVAWKGPAVDCNSWYVTGHSNGGQGTWFVLTHRPDKVVAAAPVSGYASIQSYVPYQFWTETDPKLTSVLQNSLVSYRHEILMDNLVGIPVLQQHGGDDDNVPTYHSRRLKQLITESGWKSRYVELAGRGHWFDGIMTTKPLRDFINDISRFDRREPELPETFSITVPNTGDMSSRGGIMVNQLTSPDQLGKIHVVRSPQSSKWTLRTSNIRRLHFLQTPRSSELPDLVEIDDYPLDVRSCVRQSSDCWLIRSSSGAWAVSYKEDWQSVGQRYGAQLGALDAVLRTRGRLTIRYQNQGTVGIAKQIAQNLYQYFAADCEIMDYLGAATASPGNLISVLQGSNDASWNLPSYALEFRSNKGLYVRDATGQSSHYPFAEGLGAVFLQPLANERLQLVVWGFDKAGLRYASRLVPMLTGVGQADFVIVSKACLWKGAAGVLAMGFFDYSWNVSHGSFLK